MSDDHNAVREMIRNELRNPITSGSEYYLVACKWFSQWKDFVDFDQTASEKQQLSRPSHPGAIDNSSLFETELSTNEQGNQIPRLRLGLQSDVDYEILTSVAFEKLVNVYSIIDGHRISRKAIIAGRDCTEYRVEVYEPELTVIHLNEALLSAINSSGKIENPPVSAEHQFTKRYSIITKVETVRDEARKRFNIADTVDHRIWSLSEDLSTTPSLPSWSAATWELLEDSEQSLEYVGVKPTHTLVIETRLRDDIKWPKDVAALKAFQSSTRSTESNPTPIIVDTDYKPDGSASTSRQTKLLSNAQPQTASDGRNSPKQMTSSAPSKTVSAQKSQSGASGSIQPSTSTSTLGGLTGASSGTQRGSLGVASSSPYEPGCCGLSNLGNTCFMNSALQCITHVGLLTEYFLKLDQVSSGRIASEYATVVRTIWSGQHPYYSPRSFKQAIGDFAPRFSGYAQQDSQELLAYLLDGLHEDLNAVRKKPYREEPDSISGRPDHKVAEESWRYYREREQSVIIDLFHGQLKSTLVCPDCQVVSVKFDPFLYLSVPIPLVSERPIEVIFIPYDSSTSRPTRRFARVRFQLDSAATLALLYDRACDALNRIDLANLKLSSSFPDSSSDSTSRADEDKSEPTSLNLKVSCFKLFKVEDKNVVHTALDYSTEETLDDDKWSDVSNWVSAFELDPFDSNSAQSDELNAAQPSKLTDSKAGDSRQISAPHQPRTCAYVPIYLKQEQKSSMSIDLEYNPIPPLLRVDATLLHSNYAQLVIALQRRIDRFFPLANALYQSDKHDDAAGTEEERIVQEHKRFYTVTAFLDLREKENLTDRFFTASDDSGAGQAATSLSWSLPVFELRSRHAASTSRESDKSSDASKVVEVSSNDDAFRFLEKHVVFLIDLTPAAKQYIEFIDVRRSYYSNDKIYVDSISTSSYSKRYSLSASPVTIYDCLDLFTKREQLGKNDLWYCPRCRDHKAATKKFDLWHLPPVLIIHLKRFYSTSAYYRHKNSTLVRAPIENLDLTRYVVSPDAPRSVQRSHLNGPYTEAINGENAIYDLVAVSDHGGGLYGGHYTASCRNHRTGGWYEFNDSHVSPINDEQSIVTEQAYLLVYQRRAVTNLINVWTSNGQLPTQPNSSSVGGRNTLSGATLSGEALPTPRHNTRSQSAATASAQSALNVSPLFRNADSTSDAAFQTAANGTNSTTNTSTSQSQSAQNSRAASPKLAASNSPRVAPVSVGAKSHAGAHSQSTSNLPTATGGSAPQVTNVFSSSPSSSSSTSVASSVSTIVDRTEFAARNTASSTQLGAGTAAAGDGLGTTQTPNGSADGEGVDADDEAETDNPQRCDVDSGTMGDEKQTPMNADTVDVDPNYNTNNSIPHASSAVYSHNVTENNTMEE